jgi:hypothetical protein
VGLRVRPLSRAGRAAAFPLVALPCSQRGWGEVAPLPSDPDLSEHWCGEAAAGDHADRLRLPVGQERRVGVQPEPDAADVRRGG